MRRRNFWLSVMIVVLFASFTVGLALLMMVQTGGTFDVSSSPPAPNALQKVDRVSFSLRCPTPSSQINVTPGKIVTVDIFGFNDSDPITIVYLTRRGVYKRDHPMNWSAPPKLESDMSFSETDLVSPPTAVFARQGRTMVCTNVAPS